jgi:hypothetical protein
VIWHNGKLYMFDGWTQKLDPYFGWMTLRPARGFPGYVRLVPFDNPFDSINVRADRVMVNADPV